ncbi:MAG: fibronectin type III domain-containing protein [Candidatus Electryonea clarkiae]|nr:fibronectin type III domain-containing protein [Candidatus Electryonea clarkiae]MDP8286823.1 fibronectin type III domain-containing protein [Candidatus Electryonea clarkiae]
MIRLIFLIMLIGCILLAGCTEDDKTPVEVTPQVPEAPSALTVNASSDRSVSLSWTDNADDENFMFIERAIHNSGSFIQTAKLGANVVTYIDTSLTPGVTYSYRIRARNLTGFSEYSNEGSVMVRGQVENPELSFADYEGSTPTRFVNLLIATSDASSMLLSNLPDFSDAEWEEFLPLKQWELATGDGIKTVYLKLVYQFGDTSGVINAVIEPEIPGVEVLINDGSEISATRFVRLTISAEAGAIEMRIDDNEWQPLTDRFNHDLGYASDNSPIEVQVTVRNDFLIEALDVASIRPETSTIEGVINNGAESTSTRFVTLNLSAGGGVTEMKISNNPLCGVLSSDPPDNKKQVITQKSGNLSNYPLKGKNNVPSRQAKRQLNQPQNAKPIQTSNELDEPVWQPYEESFDWELTTGGWTKLVYILVRNDFELMAYTTTAIEPLIPANPSVRIIWGGYEENQVVTLDLQCDHADRMNISNRSDFEGAQWQPFREIVTGWDLSEGGDNNAHEATVFAMFRNDFGVFSDVVSDTVDVWERPFRIEVELNRDNIAVSGSGGIETARFAARVFNQAGGPVQNETLVYFLMTDYPHGENPNEYDPSFNESGRGPTPYDPLPHDSSSTNNGSAMVSVNSGSGLGYIDISVWAYVNPNLRGTPDVDSVLIACENIIEVVAGPPSSIVIEVNEEAQDGGGAVWLLDVAATLTDIRDNLVLDNIPVQFTVEPEFATIGNAYTGNENQAGETEPGVAYATLSYHSQVTNDSISITATVLRDHNAPLVETIEDYNLPMQQCSAVLHTDPANWNYRHQANFGVFNISVYVYDGHNHHINDQFVRFLTDRGSYYASPGGGAPRNDAYTGMYEAEPGWAQRYLRISFDDAFPDPRHLESTATARVEIIGYWDNEPEPVMIFLQH